MTEHTEAVLLDRMDRVSEAVSKVQADVAVINERTARIESRVKETNGRVTALEAWRENIKGGVMALSTVGRWPSSIVVAVTSGVAVFVLTEVIGKG